MSDWDYELDLESDLTPEQCAALDAQLEQFYGSQIIDEETGAINPDAVIDLDALDCPDGWDRV